MPPAPKTSIRVDPRVYGEACRALGLSRDYPVDIRKPEGGERRDAYGVYHSIEKRIDLFIGFTYEDQNSFRGVQHRLVLTLLHELRHAWQDEQGLLQVWNVVKLEEDAERWSGQMTAKYRGLVKLHREFPGTGFKRLGKATIR